MYRRLTGPKENDILVKDMDVSKFNTIDLQKELANSMAEVFFNDNEKPAQQPAETAQPAEATEEPVYDDITLMIPKVEETETEAPVAEPVSEPEDKELEDATTVIGPVNLEEPVKSPEPAEETVIYNINDVESALKKEPGVARTVMPSHGRFDDMHEVMPKTAKNPAIVFPNYDDMVSLEGDGQISFNIPDQEVVDKQITGQISIEDVLAEWERLRSANEKAWRENMHRKVLQQTSSLFKDFDESAKSGLLEKLEEEVETSPTVELTSEEAARLGIEIEEESESEPETESEDEGGFVPGLVGVVPTIELVSKAAESVVATVPEEILTVTDVPTETETQTSDIREIVIEEEPTAEELFFDRTPYTKDSEKAEEPAEEPVTETEEPSETTSFESNNYLEAFAEASEERDALDREFLKEESATASVETAEELIEEESVVEETTEDDDNTEEAFFEDVTEVLEETEEPEEEETEPVEEITEEPATEDEAVSEVTDENPAEEEEPVEDTPAEESEEEPVEEPAEETDTVEETEPAEPEVPVIGASGFTTDQEERFEAFIQLEEGRTQLRNAIDNISMEADRGNAIIGSEDLDSAIELAKGLIMELTSKEEITGKIAKIKASTLNAKDAEETLSKLYGGALIIQDAHELRRETLDAIRRVLSAKDKRLFIVLTCLRRSKHKFVTDNSDMLASFDVSYDIEALNNKELAAFAKAYAFSKEYTIDEMGMLALHTKIDSKQTNEHSVTVTEVRDMVDEAIARSAKKNVKHFFDVLTGKRYDENDMVVLKEKDFA